MNHERTRTQLLWDAEGAEKARQLKQERQERMAQETRYASKPKRDYSVIPMGTKFGRWTVISGRYRQGRSMGYKCRCDCGDVAHVTTWNLRSGWSHSCGCFRKEVYRNTKHGQAGTSTYKIWKAMRQRCTLASQDPRGNYGGRGISYDPAWESFEQFLADMGPRPSKKLTLERKDVNGNYCKANCTWATQKEQANNTRVNVRLMFRGEMRTISQIADLVDCSYDKLYHRLRSGLSVEEAVAKTSRTKTLDTNEAASVVSGEMSDKPANKP